MSETSRKSSFSGMADLSSVHQGELLILLQKISSLPNGVKRVNELQKQSREYNQKQQACRLARQECSEERVWNNAMDYVSPEEEMEFSYRPMVSMRLEYSSSESMMQEEAIVSEASTPSSTSIPGSSAASGRAGGESEQLPVLPSDIEFLALGHARGPALAAVGLEGRGAEGVGPGVVADRVLESLAALSVVHGPLHSVFLAVARGVHPAVAAAAGVRHDPDSPPVAAATVEQFARCGYDESERFGASGFWSQ